MLIKKAEFITSFASFEKYFADSSMFCDKEICVVGRSNVGKSSFINMLAGQSKLARTSSTPGRTRLVNLFNFNDGDFMLVDLPGYGYAAAAKSDKEKWGELIEGYLTGSQKLKQVFVLMDARHEPSVQDKQMITYLYGYTLPFTIIATKCDKLSKSELNRNVQMIATSIKVGRDNIIPVSNETKYNRDKVIERIDEVLKD